MPKHGKNQKSKPRSGFVRMLLQDGPATSPFPFWVLIAPVLIFAAFFAYRAIGSLDIWWHLKTGEWIWQTRSIPRTDPFSYTAAGKPWIAHEWLFGLAVFLIEKAGGIGALIDFKVLLVTALLALTAWNARIRGASAPMTALVLGICYVVSRQRFAERPEILSLPIAVSFPLIYEFSIPYRRLLLALPLLEILWANIHGGTSLLGLAFAGIFLCEQVWQQHRSGHSWHDLISNKGLRWYAGTFMAVMAAAFLNPYGIRALTYGLLRTSSPLNIEEFASFAARLNLGLDLEVETFAVFAIVLAGLLVLGRRSIRTLDWLLFIPLLLLALWFFRFRSLFVFLLAPALAWHLSHGKVLSRIRWWLPALATILLLARVGIIDRSAYTYRFGTGVHNGVLPVGAAEFIRSTGLSGRMFNSYGFGGYLIWRLAPQYKVFIDGREDVYVGPGIAEEYKNAFESSEQWQQLVSRNGTDFALVAYPQDPPSSPEASLDVLAFPRSAWALVYFDDISALYVRRNGPNEIVIRNHEIREVQPMQLSVYLDGIASDAERKRRFLEELDANLRIHPDSYRTRFLLGIFAIKRGPAFFGQAVKELQQAATLNPEYIPAYLNLGGIYLYLGQTERAREAYERAVSIRNDPTARQQLQLLQPSR